MTSLHLRAVAGSVLWLVYLLCTERLGMAAAGTVAPSAGASRNLFAANILQVIAARRTAENVVYSPASIQSCLALAFLGAESLTAQEMRSALEFPAALDKLAIAQDYADFIAADFKQARGDGPQLRMANRIYINESLEVAPKFNELATKYFESQAVPVRFADAQPTVQQINAWIEEQTAGKITNLLQADAVNEDTSAVLVNAIYFKAKWQVPFSAMSTSKSKFQLSNSETTSVDMMYMEEQVGYAELPELGATALQLNYKDSELSMLILLPNEVEGLAQLEQKLSTVDLNVVAAKIETDKVEVFLPKFRIEFDVDLKGPLQELGMANMFSDLADFSSLFSSSQPQKVSEVRHKAYLDVNEAGSEAAAASFLKMVPMCLNLDQKRFKADHPFVFAIRSSKAVYFAGHVAKL